VMLTMAQNKRFIYEYRFIPDANNREDVKEEQMLLDTFKEGSVFYSYTVYHSDSLMKVNLEKQLKATGSININAADRKGLVRYSVSKSYPNYDVYYHSRIGMDRYKVADPRVLKWNISPEKQKIGVWQVQKATTDFAGRIWTAWFTTEIPIQDGPYKFRGLPGLIVQLEDQTLSHRFELKGIKDLNKNSEYDVFKKNEIAVNLKQFDKLLKQFEQDPTMGSKLFQANGIVMKPAEGSNMNTNASIKEADERQKAAIAKDNNRIELNPLN